MQAAIGQPQIAAPIEPQDLRRRGSFLGANLWAAERGRFAAGQIQHANSQTLALILQDGAGHAQLRVVGMRRDHQHIDRFEFVNHGRRIPNCKKLLNAANFGCIANASDGTLSLSANRG